MSLILGINAYHPDSSACILRDGKIVAAVEEERFRRIKHWAGFPSHAIAYCLKESGATLSSVDRLALNTDPNAQRWRKLQFALSNPRRLALLLDRLRSQRKLRSIITELEQSDLPGAFRGQLEYVEHHEAHLASAFYVSPFADSTAISVDGFGDFTSTAWGRGCGNEIDVGGRIIFPHSLGIFYQALTQHLGFSNYGDEYKVMGLAAYGEPRFREQLQKTLRLKSDGTFALDVSYFRHHQDPISNAQSDGAPSFSTLFSDKLEALIGHSRRHDEPLESHHVDLARSVQEVFEAALFNLLEATYKKHGIDAVALAGGCAMNSVAIGKIASMTPYRRIFAQPAGGDAGGALGAALHVAIQNGEHQRSAMSAPPTKFRPALGVGHPTMDHSFWGPSSSSQETRQLLDRRSRELSDAGCVVELINDEVSLCKNIARRIIEGDVVGWFQGRMEWGPRALGNRSILCDPRNPNARDILNVKIKRREGFRPFAPSILREHVSEWFEDDVDVPFMTQVSLVRPGKRHLIPAVTHVDGSGRLQTVTQAANRRFWQLIHCFYKVTGVPMLLNTSFNENEPIVCQPPEALDCFLRTRMDLLVIGDFVIQRKQASK